MVFYNLKKDESGDALVMSKARHLTIAKARDFKITINYFFSTPYSQISTLRAFK